MRNGKGDDLGVKLSKKINPNIDTISKGFYKINHFF